MNMQFFQNNDARIKKVSRYGTAFFLFCLTAVIIAVFYPCLHNDFVKAVDDNVQLCANPVVQGWSWQNLRAMFLSGSQGLYIPLVLVSYAIEFHFAGFNPVVYHAVNLVLHAGTAFLVYWLFLLLSRRRAAAIIVATLFAVHPLHVESVAWVTERKDLLYAFFYCCSFIGYLLFMERRKPVLYILSLFLFILSLMSKGMAATLPLLLLAADWLQGRKMNGTLLKEKVPYFALALGCLAVNTAAQYEYTHRSVSALVGSMARIFAVPYDIVFYAGKIVMPQSLSCYYVPFSRYGTFAGGIAAAAVCVFAIGACIYSLKFTRKLVFGVLWFVLSLVPVLNIVPFGMETVADRYTYLAALGIFVIAAECFVWIYRRMRLQWMRAALIAGMAVIGALSGVLAHERCKVWRDDVTLLGDALQKCGPDAHVYASLGQAYAGRGQYGRAVACLRQAVALQRGDARYCRELGDVYNQQADYGNAYSAYQEALRLDPRDPAARAALLDVLVALGNPASAEQLFIASCHNGTVTPEMVVRMGTVYARQGNRRAAENLFSQAVAFTPPRADAYYNWGLLYLTAGEKEKARAAFLQAAAGGFMGKELYTNIGNLYMEAGAYENALEAYRQALRYDPRCTIVWFNLGNLYYALASYRQALEAYEKAALLEGARAAASFPGIAERIAHLRQLTAGGKTPS